MKYLHQPVLLNEVVKAFAPALNSKEVIFVDGTIGLGGHSIAISQLLNAKRKCFKIIGIDKDQKALAIAEHNIKSAGLDKYFELIHDDFNNYSNILENVSIDQVDAVLLDLGVSSMQLDDKERGFSFSDASIRLDMRMDQSQEIDASYVINNYSQKELERVFREGEERHWKKISQNICNARKIKSIATTGELITVLAKSLPKRKGKTHFATDSFRAIRLEVNDEISRLKDTINKIASTLKPGGVLAIITFHSLEDRIVKDEFRRLENPCTCPPKLPHCICGLSPVAKILTRKPIIAPETELELNPRARSAKLRIIERL